MSAGTKGSANAIFAQAEAHLDFELMASIGTWKWFKCNAQGTAITTTGSGKWGSWDANWRGVLRCDNNSADPEPVRSLQRRVQGRQDLLRQPAGNRAAPSPAQPGPYDCAAMTIPTALTYPTPPTADQVDDYHGTRSRTRTGRSRTRCGRLAGMDRRPERADGPRPRRTAGAAGDPSPAGRAVGLPAGGRPVASWRPLVPAPQHGSPGPGRPVDGRRARRGRGVLVDPNDLSADGTTALADVAVSESGELVACATSDAGSDWRTWSVRRVATGRGAARPDPVGQVLIGGLDPRRRRVLLRPLPGATGRRGLRRAELRHGAPIPPPRHRPGRGPSRVRDAAPAGLGLRPTGLRRRPAPRPDRLPRYRPGEPGLRRATSRTASRRRPCVRSLIEGDAHYEPIAALDGVLYLRTDLDAPLGRVIAVDLADPSTSSRSSLRATTRSSRSASWATGSPRSTSTTPTTG